MRFKLHAIWYPTYRIASKVSPTFVFSYGVKGDRGGAGPSGPKGERDNVGSRCPKGEQGAVQ